LLVAIKIVFKKKTAAEINSALKDIVGSRK
jgi:hypothetical protein